MTRILDAIKTVFPDFDESSFSNDLEMMQIPGWDSMNSVNLQMQLQALYKVPMDRLLLTDETRVSEIVAFLKREKVALSTDIKSRASRLG